MKSGLTVGMSGRDMFLFDENMTTNEVYMIVIILLLVGNWFLNHQIM